MDRGLRVFQKYLNFKVNYYNIINILEYIFKTLEILTFQIINNC